jgi:hypothetical protein
MRAVKMLDTWVAGQEFIKQFSFETSNIFQVGLSSSMGKM